MSPWAAGASIEIGTNNMSENVWGRDVLRVGETIIEDHPLSIMRKPYEMNTLGLGTNSTIINSLHASDLIKSKSWGLFYGLIGSESASQMDGTIVLGGYDRAKVSGSNHTDGLAIDDLCTSRLRVFLTDISVDSIDGHGTTSIFDNSNTGASWCIQPDFGGISIPATTWDSFQNATNTHSSDGSTGTSGSNFLFDVSSV